VGLNRPPMMANAETTRPPIKNRTTATIVAAHIRTVCDLIIVAHASACRRDF
jgi:hypothetical protein